MARLPTHRMIPVIVMAVCLGCDELPTLPTEPSELVQGIVVYEHANFQGRSAHITRNMNDLGSWEGPCEHTSDSGNGGTDTYFDWDDCISSVRVAPGWEATLFRDEDYEDDSIVVTKDIADLKLAGHDCREGGLNDCVTSIQVRQR